MAKTKIEHDEICTNCGGTGLVPCAWAGSREELKTLYPCKSCNGTGCIHYVHEYEPFKERRIRNGEIKYVFANPREVFDTITISQKPEEFQEYSISYEEWIKGKKPPEHLENWRCPYYYFVGEFDHFYVSPFSKCEKCIKRKKQDKNMSNCWTEIHERQRKGEEFPIRRKVEYKEPTSFIEKLKNWFK